MIGSQWETERQCDNKWAYCFEVAHVQVLLHVVHDNAVVSRRATSVVPVVGVSVRTLVMLPIPQVHSNRAQMS